MPDGIKTINLPEVSIFDTAPNIATLQDRNSSYFNNIAPSLPSQNNNQQFLSGAATILSIALQIGTNIWQTYKQHEYQLEYMDKAQRQALERWAKENEYNDPSAVRERLIRAGLNPNLMYGQTGGGIAGSVQASSSPEAFVQNPLSGVSSMIQSMQQAQLTQSQIDLNEANAEKSRSESGESKARVNKISAEIEHLGFLNTLSESERQVKIKELDEIQSRIDLMDAQQYSEYVHALREGIDYLFASESFQSRLHLTRSEANIASANAQFLWQTLDTRVSQENLSLEQQKAVLYAMLPDLFEAAVYAQYITGSPDKGFTLTELGRSRYKTDLGMSRGKEGFQMVMDVILSCYGGSRLVKGASKGLQSYNRSSTTISN